ncbi:ABC transporter substrate-binding protein [Magnetospira sp. QH-2]|uniref:ABC transporter substrate-binding protein n=1 Tax=Magnetospira sp. (strain QH-2) TaxID=1288970 RepID=UPI0003E814C1|nr:ABC transporter substrate-binding protein [Magnetospira sp. QH-2]CCQ73420.1 Putative hopanoid biosynthesis-associated membrane protein HpnM [Magnetospira sp. QH-2]
MLRIKDFLGILLIVASTTLPSPSTHAAGADPRQTVSIFQATLLDVMRESHTLDVRERFDKLAPALAEAYHLPLMIQVATGDHWSQASGDQRRRLVAAFHKMSAATVATLFDGYSNETFRISGEKNGPGGTILVDTVLESPTGDDHRISYVVKSFPDGWRMVDVVVDGKISELSVRRSEYHRTLEKDGINGLITLLENKATKLLGQ